MSIQSNFPAIRPTLNLDFANTKRLDPRITFTRASTATYFDEKGALRTAASGAPRFDHDPATGECKGLLIEEQRTNLLLNSAVLATQNVTVTATAYTLTFYGTGTVTLSGASSAGPLVGTGANGRVSLTFTPTAGTLTLTVSGSVTNAQLEAGLFPTSYIKTEASQVTRAADSAVMTGANFSSWYRQDEGTLCSEGSSFDSATSTNVRRHFSVSDGASNNFITTYNYKNLLGGMVRVGGISHCDIGYAGYSQNAYSKMAIAYKVNDFAFSANSTSPGTDSVGTVPYVTQAQVGGLSGVYLNGHIKRIAYYPKRLSNTELQALTA